MTEPNSGWLEYQHLVLSEIKRLDREVVDLTAKYESLTTKCEGLVVKLGLLGALSVLMAGIGGALLWLVSHGKLGG